MGNFKKYVAMAACAAMAFTMTGCGSKDEGSNEDSVKWGVNYEQTGTAATYGTSHVDGIKLAVKEINAAGGVKVGDKQKKIDLDVLDNKTSDTDMPTVYNQLVQDGSKVILGPAISSLTKQAFEMASETKFQHFQLQLQQMMRL